MTKKPVPKKKDVVEASPDDSLDIPTPDTGLSSEDIAPPMDDGIAIPELLDESEQVIAAEIEDDFPYDVAFNFGFIGIGQGGSRIVETFYKIGYRRAVVVDGSHPDLQDVDDSILKMDLRTGGAGKDISYGEGSVSDKDEEIWDLLVRGFGKKVDCILVCAGLGGGTGSGGCHKVIEVARRYMEHLGRPNRVGAVITLPTADEGQLVAKNTLQTFSRLRSADPSPMIIIDNQRINDLYHPGVTKFFQVCNEQTTKLFHLFNQLAAQRSRLITFDRSEYASLLDAGIVVFGASSIKKYDTPADISSAIREQLSRTVLAQVDLKSGSKAGCIFVGGESILDKVSMDLFGGGFDMLNRLLKDDAVVHRGVYKGRVSDLRCYTMIAGLDPPAERLRQLGDAAKLPKSTIATYLGVDDSSG
jgi:cell division GTPase FtsZ